MCFNPCYFISGHGDVTQQEFDTHYVPQIEKALVEGACFVVGDFKGVDTLAQQYLSTCPERIDIYHMLDSPRTLHLPGASYVGGFVSDEERDTAMTLVSDADIVWVRKGREKSGTQRNVLRRSQLNGE